MKNEALNYFYVIMALSLVSCAEKSAIEEECHTKLLKESARVISDGQNSFLSVYDQLGTIKDSASFAFQTFQNIVDILEIRLEYLRSLEEEDPEKAFKNLYARLKTKVFEKEVLEQYFNRFDIAIEGRGSLSDCERAHLKLLGLLLASEAIAINARNVST